MGGGIYALIWGRRWVGGPAPARFEDRIGRDRVQIVYWSRRGARDIEHIGLAHDDAELAVLTAAARQRMGSGQPLASGDRWSLWNRCATVRGRQISVKAG